MAATKLQKDKEEQLRWVYETDTSDDSILLARPVFKKKKKVDVSTCVSQQVRADVTPCCETAKTKGSRNNSTTMSVKGGKPVLTCCFCAACICHSRKHPTNALGVASDETTELEIISELKRAVLNSELHNSMLESLERNIRAVRVRQWKNKQLGNMAVSPVHSDTGSYTVSYDDVNIGLIKRRDKQNVDGFNQTTLTQMYAQEDDRIIGSQVRTTCDPTEGQEEETDGDNNDMSLGTLFGDKPYDDTEGIRYENGTGPLWQEYRKSPYANKGLEDLCQLFADFDSTQNESTLPKSTCSVKCAPREE